MKIATRFLTHKSSLVFALSIFFCFWAESSSSTTASNTGKTTTNSNHYLTPKEINLDSTLIEGQLKRPDLSVVTGDAEGARNGLLRLRENFTDHSLVDAGEEIP